MSAAQQVIEAAEARASALADGDAERLDALLHQDFRWTAHVGETYNRTDYIRRNTTGHTIWRSHKLLDPEVVVVGEAAVLHADVIASMLQPPMTHQGRSNPSMKAAMVVGSSGSHPPYQRSNSSGAR